MKHGFKSVQKEIVLKPARGRFNKGLQYSGSLVVEPTWQVWRSWKTSSKAFKRRPFKPLGFNEKKTYYQKEQMNRRTIFIFAPPKFLK